MNDDYVAAVFAAGEHTAAQILRETDELQNSRYLIQRVHNQLMSSGMQGAFVYGWVARIESFSRAFDQLTAEFGEAGHDLQTAMAMLRDLDSACAIMFESDGNGASIWGGGSAPLTYLQSPSTGSGFSTEKPDPLLTGNYANADVIYINGIRTDLNGHNKGREAVAKYFSGNIAGIYNATEGWEGDLKQSFGDIAQGQWGVRPLGSNPAVNSLMDYIRSNPGKKLELVGFSQGSAIVSAALQTLHNEGYDLSKTSVTTFGGAGINFPTGKGSTYPSYRHFMFVDDPVALGAVDLDFQMDYHLDAPRILLGSGLLQYGNSHSIEAYTQAYQKYMQEHTMSSGGGGGGGSGGAW